MAIYKLSEVSKIKRGSSPRPIHNWLQSEGLKWAKISDIYNNTIKTTKQFIKKEWLHKGLIGKENDLFITNSATPGIPFFQKSILPIAYHDGFLFIKPNETIILKKYLFYKIIINKKKLIKKGNGAIFINLSIQILKNFSIDIPSLEKQQKIIDIIEPFEKIEQNINNTIKNLNNIVKNLPTIKYCKGISLMSHTKEKPHNIKQLSAKILSKRTTIIKSFEKPNTYKTNTFFVRKGSIVINTIRTYLEKFGVVFEDVDANGTLIHLTPCNENFTSIISTLLNDSFWKQANKLSKGTKMPIISKKDILQNILFKKTNEIKNLQNLYTESNQLLNKILYFKKKIIKYLIK